ncbi:nitrate/nitrite transporter NrtS [Profundibacterium mesophilum]|uniref:Phosphoenolpyruvate protein kinase n=1 Tax=Profundibacterium mesophilum KAUST100406-0324 TaxID=1037889 RepID=A0A921NXE7_9RHOB|nr:nitrate/nitrite transporter NrtS [Profundibacterium mesophilum]KAF0677111.1 hypothetical protein PMES_00425 [Profundibacterium mesophilum KAUST100406-0324]
MSEQGPPRGGAAAPPPRFWSIALHRTVVRRAARVALVVGVVLATINHGDAILRGDIDLSRMLKIMLTFCVPYSVSTYSSVLATRDLLATRRPCGDLPG